MKLIRPIGGEPAATWMKYVEAIESRVTELESIPRWMGDYFDNHGHFPTPQRIRDQFGIN